MKVIVTEDEFHARSYLKEQIEAADSSLEVVADFDTVAQTVEYLKNNKVDLMFLDIQLSDGLAFNIFHQLKEAPPVIFTTAYDQYAVRAFKVNSIDYLLKPINSAELKSALAKYKRLWSGKQPVPVHTAEQLADIIRPERQYKRKIMVKVGDRLRVVDTTEIGYIFADGKYAYAVTKKDSQSHLIDYTLEELEKMLNPAYFFRINRKFIVNIDTVTQVRKYYNRRLKIMTNSERMHDLVVSRNRVTEFKAWINQ